MDFQRIVRILKDEIDRIQPQPSQIEYDIDISNLKVALREKFCECDLDELVNGRTQYNCGGRFYIIEESLDLELVRIPSEIVYNHLHTFLTFLEGIRDKTAQVLNRKGYNRISDLIVHPRFGSQAEKIYKILEDNDIDQLLSLCYLRYPKSSPVFLLISHLFDIEDFVFLDIESLGLFSGNMLFLIGIIKFDSCKARLIQILARFPEEESAILFEAAKLLKDSKVMVSYNGKTFDWSYIEHRAAMYGIELKPPQLHIDLLHFSRRIFKQLVDRFKLSHLEKKVLNKTRKQDINSEYVPILYREYLKERESAYLYPVIVHNREDLITLVELLNFLYQGCV